MNENKLSAQHRHNHLLSYLLSLEMGKKNRSIFSRSKPNPGSPGVLRYSWACLPVSRHIWPKCIVLEVTKECVKKDARMRVP
jgi:hypothetical protein